MAQRPFGDAVLLAALCPATIAAAQGASALDDVGVRFIENRGQWATDARYVADRPTHRTRLHDEGIVLQRERGGDDPLGVVVRFAFETEVGGIELVPMEPLRGAHHYLIGARERWRAHVPLYRRVVYRGVWPGIDVAVHDANGELEYDLRLAPGARLRDAVVRCDGVDGIALNDDGSLVLATPLGDLRQAPPTTFEVDSTGRHRRVRSRFRLLGARRYGFEVERVDPRATLIVDPVVVWGSYFGGLGVDAVTAMTVHGNGRVTVAGSTDTQGRFPATPGVFQPTPNVSARQDGFVTQLDPSRSGADQLVWSTFLGGTGADWLTAVAESGGGAIVVAGHTQSTDFPVQSAYQSTSNLGDREAVLARLHADGSDLEYGTYVGGSGDDRLLCLAVDASGRIWAGGESDSADLSPSPGAYQPSLGGGRDVFVMRLDPGLAPASQLDYLTYFGTSGTDDIHRLKLLPEFPGLITLGLATTDRFDPMPPGALVRSAGQDGVQSGYLVQLDPAQSGAAQLAYFLEVQTEPGVAASVQAFAVDAAGVFTIAGQTGAFPVTAGAHNTQGATAYIARLTPDNQAVRYGTYFEADRFVGLDIDAVGAITVAGDPRPDLVTTPDALNAAGSGFVTRLTGVLDDLTYSSYLTADVGTTVVASAHFAGDLITVAGHTDGSGLPVARPWSSSRRGVRDGWVQRIDLGRDPSGGDSGIPAFTTASYPVGTGPTDVVLADVTGDGHLDIATSNRSDDVTVLVNDGSGGFGGPPGTIALPGGFGPTAIAAGDLDGDGDAADLAITGDGRDEIALIFDGVGPATTLPSAGRNPVAVAVGRLNAGNQADVVIGRFGEMLLDRQGLGLVLDGAAPVDLTIPTGNAGDPQATRVVDVALADLDGDPDLELVALARGGPDQLLLFDNDGTTPLVFVDHIDLATSGSAKGLTTTDIDQDGDVDIVVVLPVPLSDTQSVVVYRYVGGGTLDRLDYSGVGHVSRGRLARAVAAADLDADRVVGVGSGVDVLVANAVGPGAGTADVTAQFGFATSGFTTVGTVPAGIDPSSVAVADLDGNSTIDIVVSNEGGDDVTVSLVDGAIARTFGTGCAGAGGVAPRMSASGAARIGGGPLDVELTEALPNAPALLLFSFGAASTPMTFGPCSLYLELPLIQLFRRVDARGADRFALLIPPESGFIGTDVFLQWVVFDPDGAFANVLAFTEALRAQLWN